MPYTAGNLPDAVKALPEHAQSIWLAAFNAAFKQYDGNEATANKVAWAAVSKQYRKDGEKWVKRDEADNAEDELETVDIPNVEILAVGKWQGSVTRTYKLETLQNLVKSFKALLANAELNYEPPLKLGHDDDQAIIQESGLPSIGWVKALKVKGDKLVADFAKVPKKLADIIKAGGYKKVSSELYFDYAIGGKTWPAVLKAVSLLGADVPAVKTIADIRAMYDEKEQAEVVVYMADKATGLSLDGLMTELDRVIEEAEPAIKTKLGAPAIRTYLREVKTKLRALITKAQTAENAESPDESLDAKTRVVRDAWWTTFQKVQAPNEPGWVRDVFTDHVIVEKAGGLLSIPYTVSEDGGVVFDVAAAVAVAIQYVPVSTQESSAGMPAKETVKESEEHMKADITKALGLPENATDDQVVKAVQGLKGGETLAETTTLRAQLAEAQEKLAEGEASGVIQKYLAEGKLVPAQVDAAKAAYRKDPTTFTALMEKQPKLVELGERGSGTDNASPSAALSESDRKVAEALGVKLEDFAKARESEKGDK